MNLSTVINIRVFFLIKKSARALFYFILFLKWALYKNFIQNFMRVSP